MWKHHKRWFDKSISLCFFKGGLFGAGYDHSWGDGAATMNVYEQVILREGKIGYQAGKIKVTLKLFLASQLGLRGCHTLILIK